MRVCQEDFTSDQADSYDVAVGDVNGDGKTDGTDQSLVLGAFDKVTESTESADDQP